MAKAELGTKRTDPDTGKKFYDLNNDPVVSPYTGKSWPLSFFEENTAQMKMEQAEEEEVQEIDAENTDVELAANDSDDGDDAANGDDVPDDIGDDDVELEGDDDDTFLEADEDDDDDDMSGIIGVTGDDDEV